MRYVNIRINIEVHSGTPVKQNIKSKVCSQCVIILRFLQGVVRDNKKAGVFEPAMSKVKSLKFATEVIFSSF